MTRHNWILSEDSYELPANQLESRHLGRGVMVSDLDNQNSVMGTLGSYSISLTPPTANSGGGLDIRVRVGLIEIPLNASSSVRFLEGKEDAN